MAFICPDNSSRTGFGYIFNWLEFMIDLWPVRYRQERLLAWIGVVFQELDTMYGSFQNRRCEKLFLMSADGTTLKLERLLNMLFDNSTRGIYIQNFAQQLETFSIFRDGEDTGNIDNYIYTEGEDASVYGGEQPYVFRESEVSENVDFIVFIPNRIAPSINLPSVQVILDKYKFAGTVYEIRFYEE